MLHVGVGQAEGSDTRETTAMALAQAQKQLGAHVPGAAMVFAGGEFAHDEMLAYFHDALGDIPLLGCTTVGELSSAMGFSDFSVGVLLLSSSELSFGLGVGRQASDQPKAAAEAAITQARESLGGDEVMCVTILDGLSGSLTQTVDALQQCVAAGCPVFGGASGRHGSLRPMKPAQFAGKELLYDGVVTLLIAGPLSWSFCTVNSWQPIGERQVVKAAKGRTVYQIGEYTALDYYQHYLGSHSEPVSEFPLAVYEESGERFYLRGPMGYDEASGSVKFGGIIPEGASVQLAEVIRAELVEKARSALEQSLRTFAKEEHPAVALVFSCVLRKTMMGSQASDELRVLQECLPSTTPFLGFYGFGEIGPLSRGGCNYLHNTTLVVALLGSGLPVGHEDIKPLPPLTTRGEGPQLLEWKLNRSEYDRRELERVQQSHSILLRTINKEIDEARAELTRLNAALATEKARTEQLLLNILPSDIAKELKEHGHVEPVFYEAASVLFTDFVGFTKIAHEMTPKALVAELDLYFSEMDGIMEKHGLYKLKTIGDAYMAAGGIPRPNETHALDAVRAAWEICEMIERLKAEREARGQTSWRVRVGVHTGPLMAGVIGHQRFAYDVWGDTVNTASRLESNGEAGRVNVSRVVADAVKHEFVVESRGAVTAKNLGPIEMFWVVARK